jgi:parallel beta-helix repeat protein
MKRQVRGRDVIWPLLAVCLWAGGALAAPVAIYVAPGGNDDWSGGRPSANRSKSDGPLATLGQAVEKSRAAHRQTPGEEVRIELRGGSYALDRPLILTADDSGLVLAAYGRETPVITSETPLTGWHRSTVNTNIWETTAPAGWRFHELFVNGDRKGRARAPSSGFFRCVGGPIKDHPRQLQFAPGDVKESWGRDGGVELVVLQAWAQSRNLISSVEAVSNIVSLAGDAFPNNSESGVRYYIENAPDAMRPGAWRLDEQTGLVSYWPEAGEDISRATITAPRLNDLAHLEGEKDRPVHDIVFDGLVFAGTDWPLTDGHDMDVQAAVEVQAALQARGATGCAVLRCRFTRLGGYAVDLGHGCQSNRIVGCDMWDLGGGGVRLGDTDPGAGKAASNIGNEVTDNHIHQIGVVHAPAVGVLAFLSQNNVIAHNEIDHTFYTAISVGWSWGYAETPCRGNIVEYNHLHDIGQGMLSDMGGIYTLGLQPGTILRNNLIHDVRIFNYGGWGLYTDEGSSGIVLESNVVYRCQSAGFHQHYGENNLLYNNIFALNQDHQLMRTRVEPHRSFTFTNNIVYFSSGTLFGSDWSGNGFEIDHNIYFDTRNGATHPPLDGTLKWEDWQGKGHDLHSLFADPLFVAPERGDFRLKRGSPALAFGFHPLDASEAGPRKEYMKGK